ncbi:MAG: phospho-N-acetylmuramoyl-pentapeptide-transferase [Pseudomonadaceae bacterium]|nr:phospho-N-acetylmuramoyl-pentapeptide-transferase [Pseudomonadaceae bacterium]
MFYHLLYPLHEYWSALNLFQYITVRAGGAMLTAFFIWLVAGPWVIGRFRNWQKGGDTIKDILPHLAKAGTPTMGGVLVVASVVVSTLLWCNLLNSYVWLMLFVFLGFFGIGLADDWCKITRRWKRGVPGRVRLGLGALVSGLFVLAYIRVAPPDVGTLVVFPFLKSWIVAAGIAGIVLFGVLVIVGSANAVNLTDGLDGLVSIPAVIVSTTMAILAYVVGRVDFTAYLALPHVPGAGEVAIVCAALSGAMLGFLWFNAPPAKIFLGDTGSLPVGALLGAVAVMIKQEFALAIIGGLFVLETVSVMMQVASFKLTGKRMFKMAPLHHHFEQSGWPESTIVVRFWILSVILALVGLATLKVR